MSGQAQNEESDKKMTSEEIIRSAILESNKMMKRERLKLHPEEGDLFYRLFGDD